MEATIKGQPEEIAALVLAVQERREYEVRLEPDVKKITQAVIEAARATSEPIVLNLQGTELAHRLAADAELPSHPESETRIEPKTGL